MRRRVINLSNTRLVIGTLVQISDPRWYEEEYNGLLGVEPFQETERSTDKMGRIILKDAGLTRMSVLVEPSDQTVSVWCSLLVDEEDRLVLGRATFDFDEIFPPKQKDKKED